MPKHLQCTLAAIATCILGSLIVGLVTITEWLAPTTPALILLAAALVPSLFVGLLVASPPEPQPWTRSLVLTATIPGLVVGVITVAIGLFWAQPQTRANIAGALPADFQEGAPLLRALNDPANQVSTAACIALAQDDFKNHYRNVFSTLTSRPEVALPCLQNTQATNANILTDLAQAWHQNLINEPLNATQACGLSNALATIQTDQTTQTARILQCSLQAQSPDAQHCCAQTLNQSYPNAAGLANILQSSHQTLADHALGPDLVAASFYDNPRIGAMSLKNQEFQRIALVTNCAALQIDVQAPTTTFIKLANSLDCDGQNQQTPDRPDAWGRICQNLTRQFTARPDQTPSLALCAALGDENRFAANLKAEHQAILDQETEDLSDLTAQIDLGDSLSKEQNPQDFLRDLTGESFAADRYADENIRNLRNLLNSTDTSDDEDDDSPMEIDAESLKMLEKFPEYIEHLKATDMPQGQIRDLEKISETLKNPGLIKSLPKK